jgi:hypothetical protein
LGLDVLWWVRATYPNLSAADVVHRLTAINTDKDPPGRDDQLGYGIVRVAALTAAVPPLRPSVYPTPIQSRPPPQHHPGGTPGVLVGAKPSRCSAPAPQRDFCPGSSQARR